MYMFYGADGSELVDGDDVYCLVNPIAGTIQTIDCFSADSDHIYIQVMAQKPQC